MIPNENKTCFHPIKTRWELPSPIISTTAKSDKLRVFSSQFEEDEIPMNQLFRPYDEMPELEQIALQIAEGNILDVGAGSGCHALALQEMGKKRYALSIFPRFQ